MHRTLSAISAITLALASCSALTNLAATAEPAGGPTPTPAQPRASSLSLEALQNTRYHSPDWGDFQLAGGFFHRPPAAPGESANIYVTQMVGQVAFGDLNGDGVQDAAVFLSTQNGGTGHFVELAAVIDNNGQADNVATVSLGDRVVVESARIEAGLIVLDMRVHGPNDGLCCPSQFETWRFRLENGQLVRQP